VRGSLSSPAVCDRRINPSGVLGVTAGRSTGLYIFILLSASLSAFAIDCDHFRFQIQGEGGVVVVL